MFLGKLRDIEWKTRSKVINPIVWKLQDCFWDNVRFLIDSNKIKSSNELAELFNWKSIAIIWNAPYLEKSWLWIEIDNYDIVIRFNRWILEDLLDIENTWIKTDIWSTWMLDTLTSIDIKKQIKQTSSNINMLIPFPYEKNNCRSVGFNIAMLELLFPYKIHNKFYMDSSFYDKIYKEIWSEPSSWFIVIKYILEQMIVSKIWLFWFTFSSDNRITWNTYANQHDFSKEEEIIKELINNNEKISLF